MTRFATLKRLLRHNLRLAMADATYRDPAQHRLHVSGQFAPLTAVAELAESGLFSSYVVYERGGSWWVAGDALAEITVDGPLAWTRSDNGDAWHRLNGNPITELARLLDTIPMPRWHCYGWIGFEAGLPGDGVSHCAEVRGPIAHFAVPRTEVRIRRDGIVVTSKDPGMIADVRDVVTQRNEPLSYVASPVDVSDPEDRAAYQSDVQLVLDSIARGRVRKVVLSRRVPVPYPVDLVRSYVLGRQHHTPARSFLLSQGGRHAAGFSPETIVELAADRTVSTHPLAGTRAVGQGGTDEARLRAELLVDSKEIYEHCISVKAVCDNLAEVCAPSTVSVRDFMSVRRRGSVQHLGSTVSGRLAHGRTGWEALAALFPAVTASGLPRLEAIEHIMAVEQRPRGLYGGAVVQSSSSGMLDAALVLRSIYSAGSTAWLQAGAGVVGCSTPEREYEETCEKLAGVANYVVRGTPVATSVVQQLVPAATLFAPSTVVVPVSAAAHSQADNSA
jgi:salicylate synthetase